MSFDRSKIKNVVFIMLDTLQFNYLGCYGNETVKTPNLDRFARQSVLFENAYSEGVPTIPVRRALMTGRFTLPYGGWQPLGADDTTITDIMWGRNMQTALIYDTAPMRLAKFGYSRGFDYVDFCPGQELDHTTFENEPLDPALKPEDFTSATMVWDENGEYIDDESPQLLDEIGCFLRQQQHRRTEADSYVAKVMNRTDHWLKERRDKNRPFFLWIDSFDPHEPWDPPSVWKGEPCPYDPEYEGNPIMLAPWVPVEGRITERECEHIRALYMEKITDVDRWVGRTLDSLREQGLMDETMVVVMSDHGQPMGEGEHGHGIMRKSRPWPYEELVHVPLMMHIPGVEGGQRISSFVQNVDVTATIMDVLGLIDTEDGVSDHGMKTFGAEDYQGESLLPMMQGEVDKIRDYAIAGYYGMSWSIITDDYSYVHWLVSEDEKNNADCVEGADKVMSEDMWTCTAGAKIEVPQHNELYDRRKDPFQLNNIAEENPEKAEELLQKLKLVIGELRTS
ncbi:sulfatase [Maridesulfovibrio salexigens]|uniref:Sulfatase n=1 Tax=Maridesulfovibrio salexigens (strain ATCC 14822 / DSM 2638 / NCIMB 8403 / VKM B-1763) TaxID=526222 RepID=C6BWZ7_MARSD|nr:sulfatase [Maridesulfovibrio salexigens]ACS78477.1 sulfatase [Maridesulfovibrio salexigens DSM 2638]